MLSAHVHNYGLVKVVNSASGTLWLQQQSRYRLCNVRVGYVLYRTLVLSLILYPSYQITKEYGLKHAEKVRRKIESGEEGEEVQGLLEQWLREGKMTEEEALMNAADMFFAGVDTVRIHVVVLLTVTNYALVLGNLLQGVDQTFVALWITC